MKIDYRKSFLKELSKIPSETRLRMENFVFEKLPKANSIFEIGIVEQMKGYRSYYKVRFGSYRIGFKMENDTVIFERALHRKDIYRYFP
jgi:mRNA interferase RelE/StbE